MSNKLTLDSFNHERVSPESHLRYFTHKTEDGREVCLEDCMSGYCVGIYDATGNIIGEKTCTNITGGMTFLNVESTLQKAVDIANEKLGYV